MLHLFGGAIWIGGLAGLLLLALPGGAAVAGRGAFWSAVIRRFSAVAMGSVAAVMTVGYRVSGRLARSRANAAAVTASSDQGDFVGA